MLNTTIKTQHPRPTRHTNTKHLASIFLGVFVTNRYVLNMLEMIAVNCIMSETSVGPFCIGSFSVDVFVDLFEFFVLVN